MRMTKIVVTLGPATDSREVLRDILLAGANVCRINFSHGNPEEWLSRITLVNELRDELDIPVALLADTRGPEVRVGMFREEAVELTAGDNFILTTAACEGDARRVSVTYDGLPRDVRRGTRILLDDGLIELKVESVTDTEISTTIINGGSISSKKSINVPSIRLSLPFISSKDRADFRFIAENSFDFIAASFTQSAQDVQQLREELHRLNASHIRIISKIENAEGVSNMNAILEASDGVMVARGDMGVEIALEELPIIQKALIKSAYESGKHVITATQMLESMIHNPRPTRAETSDVANAIYDGTSAIMLSGETAKGKYPVEAVRTMARIAERTERDIDYRKRFFRQESEKLTTVANAISHATVTTAHDLSARAILTLTKSGMTARHISRYRPACPIISCTVEPLIQRQLNLAWGVVPLLMEEQSSTEALFSRAVEILMQKGLVEEGDLVAITAGSLGISGTTNLLKVHVVGDQI